MFTGMCVCVYMSNVIIIACRIANGGKLRLSVKQTKTLETQIVFFGHYLL